MFLKFIALVAVLWIVLLPPLFTQGACTREFDDEGARIQADRRALATLPQATAYFAGRGVEYRLLTVQQCRRARIRFLETCGPGSTLYATVPVRNLVCRIYRDEDVAVQLHFDEKERLARLQVDMRPYRTFPAPGFGPIHWAR